MNRMLAESAPRFEFRSFGQEFDRVHHRMSRLSMPVPEMLWERCSEETYIVSRTNDVQNIKIRDGMIDIKQRVQSIHGLEQWYPLLKDALPLPRERLRDIVFNALQVSVPEPATALCAEHELLALVRAHPALAAVRVRKQRFAYLVNHTICEYAVVLVNGARVVTVATESVDPSAVQRTMHDLGMTALENVNYLTAIKRVIGMDPSPLATT